jgi:hypothetical protein
MKILDIKVKSWFFHMIGMKKKLKKMTITQKEHDEWHKKHKDYDGKISREHEACHRKFGITIKKK